MTNEATPELPATLETAPETIEDDPIEVRKNKREKLLAEGPTPYAHKFDVTARVADIEARYAELENGAETEDVVQMAGRVVAYRNQGKIIFIDLRDATGDIQIFTRINVIGEEAFGFVKDIVDIGDWIGVTGTVMRTRRGQLSIAPTTIELLTKSLRPLPEKFHGLADKELRFRQRYVDLIANPEVKKTFEARFKIVSAMRRRAEELGFLEVETPMLHPIPGGATARPFVTHHNALDRDFYLRVAPELNLKRLLVGGFERVFEINRCFRNEGMDPFHNPEFTTLEAYQAYTDINGMIEFAKTVIQAACLAANDSLQIVYQGREIDLENGWQCRTMSELVSEACGCEVSMDTPYEELKALCEKHEIQVEKSWGVGKLIAELYDELVEDNIVQPTFVTMYPTEVSPLAKKNADDPRLTDRFELVIAGSEFANAFSELNDPVDQSERFHAQVAAKEMGDDEAMGYDADYIRALEYGMPPAGGIGIGVDRLCMLLTDAASIRDVLLFPAMKPVDGQKSEKREAAQSDGDAPVVFAPAPEPIDFSKVEIEPLFADFVDFETFSKSDFRAVKVLACEAVPKSKKLLRFTLDDGTDTERTILSGIHAYYEPEELVGKTCVAITNLPPRPMMGIESCGMLISAVHHEEGEERLHLLMLDEHIPAGAKMY